MCLPWKHPPASNLKACDGLKRFALDVLVLPGGLRRLGPKAVAGRGNASRSHNERNIRGLSDWALSARAVEDPQGQRGDEGKQVSEGSL